MGSYLNPGSVLFRGSLRSKIYVDIEISAEGDISLTEAHDIAEAVHHTIENSFKDVKHCMVHVNPVNA